jgi:hypothetical protein
MAVIDWPAAAGALGASLPCSGGERWLLQVTASLAAGIPAGLRVAAAGLDGAAPGSPRTPCCTPLATGACRDPPAPSAAGVRPRCSLPW